MVPLHFYLLETNNFIEQTTNLTKKVINVGKNLIDSKILFQITLKFRQTIAQKNANYA
jgi:hypothetical protein